MIACLADAKANYKGKLHIFGECPRGTEENADADGTGERNRD
jgi:hypothetical protein